MAYKTEKWAENNHNISVKKKCAQMHVQPGEVTDNKKTEQILTVTHIKNFQSDTTLLPSHLNWLNFLTMARMVCFLVVPCCIINK